MFDVKLECSIPVFDYFTFSAEVEVPKPLTAVVAAEQVEVGGEWGDWPAEVPALAVAPLASNADNSVLSFDPNLKEFSGTKGFPN